MRSPITAAVIPAVMAIAVASCESKPASTPTTTPAATQESPAESLGELTNTGTHCFASAVDAAAAAARIEAFAAVTMIKIQDARRIANAGGPLPGIDSAHYATASNPDARNCIEVKQVDYDPLLQ